MPELALLSWLAPLAGVRPGGRPTFLPRSKKVGKEMRPHCPRPFASLRATCVGHDAGCAAELALRFARRSDNCGKSDDEASLSFGRLATPHRAQRRRGQRGEGGGMGHRFARPEVFGAGS